MDRTYSCWPLAYIDCNLVWSLHLQCAFLVQVFDCGALSVSSLVPCLTMSVVVSIAPTMQASATPVVCCTAGQELVAGDKDWVVGPSS